MSEHWPGTTGLPQNPTHRVVRGRRATQQCLKPPSHSPHVPEWTPHEKEAGGWSESDAKLLAEKHSATSALVRIEPIPTGGFLQQVKIQPDPGPPRRS